MREIKFRAFVENYDGDTEIINDYLTLNKENNHFEGADLTNDYPCVLNVLNVMQFTGLKDKNGVEIFEGDIVLFERFDEIQIFGFIQYNTLIASYEICVKSKFNNIEGCYHIHPNRECLVIGNIHQNKDLLNEQ